MIRVDYYVSVVEYPVWGLVLTCIQHSKCMLAKSIRISILIMRVDYYVSVVEYPVCVGGGGADNTASGVMLAKSIN